MPQEPRSPPGEGYGVPPWLPGAWGTSWVGGASTIRAKFQIAATNVPKLGEVYRFLSVLSLQVGLLSSQGQQSQCEAGGSNK